MIIQAIQGQPLPIYGDGSHIRDWLFVEDHAEALLMVLAQGQVGRTYNIGGRTERTNLDLVRAICAILDEVQPRQHGSYAEQIAFVADRPGHDARYAVDSSRIETELGWRANTSLEDGLRKTVRWFLHNSDWWQALQRRPGVGARLGAA